MILKNDDWVNDNGNYKFERLHLDFKECEPCDQEIKSALTKLNFRGNVLLKARKKEVGTPKI